MTFTNEISFQGTRMWFNGWKSIMLAKKIKLKNRLVLF